MPWKFSRWLLFPLFALVGEMAELEIGEIKDFEQFLMTVPGSEPAGRVRKALAFFESKEVFSQEDLDGIELGPLVHEESKTAISAGLASFVRKAVEKATTRTTLSVHDGFSSHSVGVRSPVTPMGHLPNMPGEDVLKAMLELGLQREDKKKVEKLHVDLGTKVPAIDLRCLKQPSWPKSAATDDLATEVARLKKRGIDEPYVFRDLKEFLPFWAEFKDADKTQDEAIAEDEMSSDYKALASVLEKKFGGPAKPKKWLDIVRWSVAFDKFALAGAVVEHQLSFAAALAHKDVCMGVGLAAPRGVVPRRAGLAPIYDEVCRRSWADRSAGGEHGFNVNDAALVLDKTLLKQAEDLYDAAGRFDTLAKSYGKGLKGKSDVTCYKCGEVGHTAANCWNDAKGKKGGGKGKGMQCYNCRGFGHKSSDGPNNRGEKRHADGSRKW